MSIEDDLRAYILDSADISVALSGLLYPMFIPQGVGFPAATYQRIDTPQIASLGGPSGTEHPRIQYTIWADTIVEARSIAKLIKSRLNGVSGTIGSNRVQIIWVEDDADMPNISPDAEVRRMYGRRLDVIVWHCVEELPAGSGTGSG